MVQYVPNETTWSDTAQSLSQNFGNAYLNKHDEQALQKAIGSLKPNATPREILDAVTKTKTYSPEAKQQMLKNYMGAAEFEEGQKEVQKRAEREAAKDAEAKRHAIALETEAKAKNEISANKNKIAADKESRTIEKEVTEKTEKQKKVSALVDRLDVPEETKVALREGGSESGVEDLLKHQIKAATEGEKLNPFQKKVQEKQAEEYVNLSKDIPKLEGQIGDLDYAENLAKNTSYIGNLVGTENATELQGIVFPTIEPIVKMFNPSGPIAVQKLKIIQDKYKINPWDPQWVINGKIKALRRFGTQALKRAQDRRALIEKYNGLVPTEVEKSFDKDSDSMSDAMADYDVKGEEADQKEVPLDAKKHKTATGPDGTKYYSDGTRWLKK